MRFLIRTALLFCSPLLHAAEWSLENYSSLDLLAGRTGIADVRPTNDPHDNSPQMMEQNSGIYRGQWSWQSEMPELLYEMMHTGDAGQMSPSGFCALQAACVYADESLFMTLLENGVPVDTRPGDWQQLGYVGDTPLGLLIRFMTPRSAAVRVRMAKVLLEKGANPDAPMTTWKGNRVVTIAPFCELGAQAFNHEMRLLLLQYGDKNLSARMADWQLNWEWYNDELVQHLKQNGLSQSAQTEDVAGKREVGHIPLLDLIRKGDVEGVRLALEAGASIEVSPRARRYGQEPLFNIPARRKDSPEVAVEIARLLIDAGADVNALNRRGRSLRIHYDRYHSKASRALCAYLKSRGALIHPDSPENAKRLEQLRQEKAKQEQQMQEAKPAPPAAGIVTAPALTERPTDEAPVAPPQGGDVTVEAPVAPAQEENTSNDSAVAPVLESTPVVTETAQGANSETAVEPETATESSPAAEVSEPQHKSFDAEVAQAEHMKNILAEVQSQLAEMQSRLQQESAEPKPEQTGESQQMEQE